jgi:hypothetical protein
MKKFNDRGTPVLVEKDSKVVADLKLVDDIKGH